MDFFYFVLASFPIYLFSVLFFFLSYINLKDKQSCFVFLILCLLLLGFGISTSITQTNYHENILQIKKEIKLGVSSKGCQFYLLPENCKCILIEPTEFGFSCKETNS